MRPYDYGRMLALEKRAAEADAPGWEPRGGVSLADIFERMPAASRDRLLDQWDRDGETTAGHPVPSGPVPGSFADRHPVLTSLAVAAPVAAVPLAAWLVHRR